MRIDGWKNSSKGQKAIKIKLKLAMDAE